MREADGVRHGPTFHVAVRYESPPVAGLPARVWVLVETRPDEARARESARLINTFVIGDGGAVAVVEETGQGAPLRVVDVFADGPVPDIVSVTPTSRSVREAFAARMTEHWSKVLAARSGRRGAREAPTGWSVRHTIAASSCAFGVALVAGFGVWAAVRPSPPTSVEGPPLTASEMAELAFQREGGYTMLRPSGGGEHRNWDGEPLYRAYRVHPDGRREFVGFRNGDGSEPPPPPDTRPGNGGGVGGSGGGRGSSEHLRAIAEGFRRGN